jgi:hypothetical protein
MKMTMQKKLASLFSRISRLEKEAYFSRRREKDQIEMTEAPDGKIKEDWPYVNYKGTDVSENEIEGEVVDYLLYDGFETSIFDPSGLFTYIVKEPEIEYLGYSSRKDVFLVAFNSELYSEDLESAIEEHEEALSQYESDLRYYDEDEDESEPDPQDYEGYSRNIEEEGVSSDDNYIDGRGYVLFTLSSRGSVQIQRKDVEKGVFDNQYKNKIKREYSLIDLKE